MIRFKQDNELGYRLDTTTPNFKEELTQRISEQYWTERKEMSEKEWEEQLECSVEGILKGKYSAWIDIWEGGNDILHIEPDYGFGTLDFGISGVEL